VGGYSMKAIVTGMIATYPVGGVAWDYGQYALGLEKLGFEVYYLEDTGSATYDPATKCYGEDCSFALEFLEQSLRNLSPTLGDRWHFRSMDDRTFGLDTKAIEKITREAVVFVNVSGSALLRSDYMACRRKVLIDTDPGWNHFVNYPKWDADPGWRGTCGYRAHDYFFTYAEQIGKPGCELPTLGIQWQPTRPPVVLNCWNSKPPGEVWNTVMTWNNFCQAIEANGKVYGTKELEFGQVESLPQHAPARFEVAVGGASPPVDRWRDFGWSVIDSHRVSGTMDAYRNYIESSRGEFSVAKNVYAATRSGWFSCRSVCYLAAGRPVVVQDTGFSEIIPTGNGLIAFKTLEEATAAINTIESNYETHQQHAREIASSYFDAKIVLSNLLRRIGLG
jgi:hypothetical protein